MKGIGRRLLTTLVCEVRPKSWTNMTMLFLTVLGSFTGHGDFYADSSCSLY